MKHVAVAPCNSDVVTVNVTKHQFTSPRIGKDVRADFLCLHCSPNAVGDNTWAYFKGRVSVASFH